MHTAPPLTHFAQMLTDDGERAIHLGHSSYPPDMQPQNVVSIYPDEIVKFHNHPALTLADTRLVVQLAADYRAARRWLHEQQPNQYTGEWYPLPDVTTFQPQAELATSA